MCKHVLIFGLGAIGAFYGAHLQKAGVSVSVVVRHDAEIVKASGITIEGKGIILVPDNVYSVDALPEAPLDWDAVIVATKAISVETYFPILKKIVSEKSPIVLIQNGIHIETPFVQQFQNPIYSGLAFICVTKTSPTSVLFQDFGRLAIGAFERADNMAITWFKEAFDLAGVPCLIADNIRQKRWEKMAWNVPFNALSVLCGGKTTQQILSEPDAVNWVKSIMKEVQSVAEADGIRLSDTVIDRHIADTLKMTPYKTSMLVDFESGRPMEIEAILGNLLRFSNHNRILIPQIQTLYHCLHLVEAS